MFSDEEILNVSTRLGIDFKEFTFNDLKKGINIELEHGTINPKTNVTNNDLELTMKIALAHLNEFPNYYNENYGLPKLEQELVKKETYYLK